MAETKNIRIGSDSCLITKTEETAKVFLRRIICRGTERILGAEVSGTRRIWQAGDGSKFAFIDGRWHTMSFSAKNHRYQGEEMLFETGSGVVAVDGVIAAKAAGFAA